MEYAPRPASQLDSQDELIWRCSGRLQRIKKAAAKEERGRRDRGDHGQPNVSWPGSTGRCQGCDADVSRAGGSYNDAEKAAAIYNEIKHAEATKRAAAEQDAPPNASIRWRPHRDSNRRP